MLASFNTVSTTHANSAYSVVLTDATDHNALARTPLGTGVLVGRANNCSITIDDKLLSRKHCLIFERGGVFYVRALNKKCLIAVNGQVQTPRVDVVVLPGSTIAMGSHVYYLDFVKHTSIIS